MHDAGYQTDKVIAADERLAKAMERSVSQGQEALNATIEQFRLDQRAWIGPNHMAIREMHAPDPIVAEVTISNSGKTPAIKTNVVYVLHSSDKTLNINEYAKHPIEPAPPAKPLLTLFPGTSLLLIPQTGTTDEAGIQSVANGRKYLYLFGRVEYYDVFNVKHETRFCSLYDPRTKAFGPCDSYNFAD